MGKPVDNALEQLNQEERDKKLGLQPPKNHVEHECIPPSIRDFNKILQVEQVSNVHFLLGMFIQDEY